MPSTKKNANMPKYLQSCAYLNVVFIKKNVFRNSHVAATAAAAAAHTHTHTFPGLLTESMCVSRVLMLLRARDVRRFSMRYRDGSKQFLLHIVTSESQSLS